MNEALSAGFARLVGQKATEEEMRRLYEVKECLGLADNDALWVVLFALQHYESLYREYPARIAEEARRTLAEIQNGFAAAAAVEAKRAQRKLSEAVADAAIKIASQRSEMARWQGAAAAVGMMVAFGSLCLAIGHALGAGRIPPWASGTGSRRLVSAALGAPAGWMMMLLLLPVAGFWIRSGWRAAWAPQATIRERLLGWAMTALATSSIVALGVLVARLL